MTAFDEIRALREDIAQLQEKEAELNAKIYGVSAWRPGIGGRGRAIFDKSVWIHERDEMAKAIAEKQAVLNNKIQSVNRQMAETLTEDECKVVRMHELDGLSFRQIQRRTGMSKDAAFRRYKKAMQKLKGVKLHGLDESTQP